MKKKLYLFLIIIAIIGINIPIVSAATIKKTSKNKITTIPILMYHYIRDYYNIHDPLGINLSVSPKKFAEQLDCLKQLGYQTITFNDVINNKLPAKPIILTFDDGYKDFYTNAFKELKKRNMKAVSYVIADRIDAPGYLSLPEIKELNDNGIEIGDHTWSHPDLRTLDEKKLTWEIMVSKNYLSHLINESVVSFAYPSGKYNEAAIAEVEKAGYNYAVTTNLGFADFAKNNLLLNRLRIFNNTNLKIVLKK